MRLEATAVVAVVVVCASAPAAAQTAVVLDPAQGAEEYYEAQLREPPRFVIGFDFGLGALVAECTECERSLGGLAVDVFSGALIARRLALIGELHSVLHLLPADSDERGLLSHTFLTAAARFWATPQFWLQAGAGVSTFRADSSADDFVAYSPAATFAIGGELDHRPNRGIDLSARFGVGRYEGDEAEGDITLLNVAAVVGWHWL